MQWKSQNSNPGHLALEGACLTLIFCFSVIPHCYKIQILVHIKQKSITIHVWLIIVSTVWIKYSFFWWINCRIDDRLSDNRKGSHGCERCKHQLWHFSGLAWQGCLINEDYCTWGWGKVPGEKAWKKGSHKSNKNTILLRVVRSSSEREWILLAFGKA